MAILSSFLVDTTEVGSPFNGCASGSSVTISSIVVRGSTSISGRRRWLKGAMVYTPIPTINTLRLFNNIIPAAVVGTPTLPTRLPTTPHLSGQAEKYLTSNMSFSWVMSKKIYGDPLPDSLPLALGDNPIVYPPTYSSVAIGGITVRQSTTMTGLLLKRDIATTTATLTPIFNFARLLVSEFSELQLFGQINHRLYLDY